VVEYASVIKLPFSFWVGQPGEVRLEVIDTTGTILHSAVLPVRNGFNQYRWDLVVSRQASMEPYFVHYERFLTPGTYTARLHTNSGVLERSFTAVK